MFISFILIRCLLMSLQGKMLKFIVDPIIGHATEVSLHHLIAPDAVYMPFGALSGSFSTHLDISRLIFSVFIRNSIKSILIFK